MPKFEFTAISPKGQSKGQLEARSRREAFAQIEKQGLQPIELHLVGGEGGSASNSAPAPLGNAKLNAAQLVLFTEELSELLEAGMQLEQALRVIEQHQEGGSLRAVAGDLRQRIREGASLATALRALGKSFDELYCSLVSIGEMSGALDDVLRRQAQYLVAMRELRAKVLSSLAYPAFLSAAGLLLVVVFMTVLVPQLNSLLVRTGGELPLITRVLMGTSDFTIKWGWLVALIVFGGGFAGWAATREGEPRRWRDKTILHAPLIGQVISARFLAQFCQSLATLVVNGIPLLGGLQILSTATANTHLREALTQAATRVADGAPLSKALSKAGFFPSRVIDMIVIGEQTGRLGPALEKAARRYDQELSTRISRITSLIQPVIIVVMALLVGAVAFSMVSGIFQTISSLRM